MGIDQVGSQVRALDRFQRSYQVIRPTWKQLIGTPHKSLWPRRLWRDGCRPYRTEEQYNFLAKSSIPWALQRNFPRACEKTTESYFWCCCGQSALCLKPSPQMLISHPVKRPTIPDMFELTGHEHMLYCKLMPLYLLPQALKAWLYYTALRFQLPSHSTQPLLRLYRSDAEW